MLKPPTDIFSVHNIKNILNMDLLRTNKMNQFVGTVHGTGTVTLGKKMFNSAIPTATNPIENNLTSNAV